MQVASLDSQESVAKEWKQINKKAAPLFKDKITTNIEKAKVNNKTHYRLKLGEYFNFKSASSLFQVEFVANVETINVSGVTYYRLKLGAYQEQANAAADCDKLKQRQINCIVSHYTQQPLK